MGLAILLFTLVLFFFSGFEGYQTVLGNQIPLKDNFILSVTVDGRLGVAATVDFLEGLQERDFLLTFRSLLSKACSHAIGEGGDVVILLCTHGAVHLYQGALTVKFLLRYACGGSISAIRLFN